VTAILEHIVHAGDVIVNIVEEHEQEYATARITDGADSSSFHRSLSECEYSDVGTVTSLWRKHHE